MTTRTLVVAWIGLLCATSHPLAQGWDTPDEPGRSERYLSLLGGALDGDDNPVVVNCFNAIAADVGDNKFLLAALDSAGYYWVVAAECTA